MRKEINSTWLDTRIDLSVLYLELALHGFKGIVEELVSKDENRNEMLSVISIIDNIKVSIMTLNKISKEIK